MYMSAYADDITLCISGQNDVMALKARIGQYEKASSARVNWEKSEGFSLADGETLDLQYFQEV